MCLIINCWIGFSYSRPIRLENFSEHYRMMSADSDFRFSEEFEELKHVGREQPCSAADLPCNRPKNRFTNILPYDHSRFKLQPVDDEEGSDYINANYVPVSKLWLNSVQWRFNTVCHVTRLHFMYMALLIEAVQFSCEYKTTLNLQLSSKISTLKLEKRS